MEKIRTDRAIGSGIGNGEAFIECPKVCMCLIYFVDNMFRIVSCY